MLSSTRGLRLDDYDVKVQPDQLEIDLDSDVTFNRRTMEIRARTEIRKAANNLYNRLHSIVEDSRFVGEVRRKYPRYALVDNQRCGSWYVDTALYQGSKASAYFKSADGHYNAWTFSLRRPNIHIIPLIVEKSGVIIVDSTRSGKRMPDALSKTVPIWCAVVNRAIQLRRCQQPGPSSWDTNLYTPSEAVSKQEHWQLERRLDEWSNALAASSYDLPELSMPIRPIWITPSTTRFPDLEHASFYPIICVSVSKVVQDGLARREAGYTYVQGAGDDHESWSLGLTPTLFWRFEKQILSSPEDDIDDFVRSLVFDHEDKVQRWQPPTHIRRVKGLISLSSNSCLPEEAFSTENVENTNETCYLIINSKKEETEKRGRLLAQISLEAKAGGKSLVGRLPGILRFIGENLGDGRSICVSCDTGNDASVIVALAALQSFFDDEGHLVVKKCPTGLQVNKDSLRTRLQWIIASKPEANPSRAALRRLNDFFMSNRLDA